MSQTRISDFFSARKPRNNLKRKGSNVADFSSDSPVKRLAVNNVKSRKRKDGLADIRDVFNSLTKFDQPLDELPSAHESEQTPERQSGGILYFQENKWRRKQVDMKSPITASKQTPSSAVKSARKRIFDAFTDDYSDVVQNDPIKECNEQITNAESVLKTVESKEKNVSTESKLTVVEVKQRLANCSKLSELRYRLAQINDCAEKLKEFQAKTKSPTKTVIEPVTAPKENKSIIESPKKYLSTNVTQDRKHAFEKFANLASKEHETGLLLPFKFRTLLETFRCTDFVVSLLHNRDEVCTFEKLKKSFEEMTRKKFDMSRLTQILRVFPDCYKITYVRNTSRVSVSDGYQYVISALNVSKMTPSVLLSRKELFHNKLLDIVKKEHQLYLSSFDPPVSVANESLQRWHPNFKLEDIPDIEPQQSLIPALPSESSSQTFAQCFRARTETEDETVTVEVSETTETRIDSGVLKGISSSLLMKIRAKEAMAVAREMVRKPENEKRIAMLNRLPEIIKIIHNYFVCDGRGAIRIDEVLQKCVQSYRTFISMPDVKEHITLLCDMFPEWIYLLNVRKGEYLKIDKTVTLSNLINRLDDMRSKMRHK